MKKKICFIVGNPQAFHGFFEGQLRFLSSDFNVCGIANEGEWIKKTENNEGIKIYINKIERKISPLKDFISILSTFFLLRKINPDIIHANTPKVGLVSMISGKMACIKTRIYMCHGLRYQGANGLFRHILKLFEKISCLLATHVVCVSQGVKDCLIKDGICNSAKLYVVNKGSINGFDPKLLIYKLSDDRKNSIKSECGIPNNSIIYCFIGRLVKDKGVNQLVKAFVQFCNEYHNAHMLLVGSYEQDIDPIEEITQSMIEQCQNIHAIGWQDNITPYLCISDIFVLPSYREGLSTTLLEAGSLCKPSITTNVTGCNDIIVNGFNGILIDDPKEKDEILIINQLKDAMRFFINCPMATKDSMGLRAREFVVNNYSREMLWNKYREFYLRISNEHL